MAPANQIAAAIPAVLIFSNLFSCLSGNAPEINYKARDSRQDQQQYRVGMRPFGLLAYSNPPH
jgi:hypothetical protein